MQQFNRLLILLLLFPFCLAAQTVPPAVLARVAKMYTDKGMTLEKTYVPDVQQPARNKLFKSEFCYPGKKVTVITVVAAKPGDWFFKVRYNDKVSRKDHECKEVKIEGKSYWYNHLTVYAPMPALHNSDHCMTILAYDVSDVKLPVYMMVLTSDK